MKKLLLGALLSLGFLTIPFTNAEATSNERSTDCKHTVK